MQPPLEAEGPKECMQQKHLSCNPDFYTCSSPKPMIWERKGMADVTTVQKLGRELSEWSREVAAALAGLGLTGVARSRHSAEPLFSALLPFLQSLRNTWLPQPYQQQCPLPCQAPQYPPSVSLTCSCSPVSLHLSHSKSEIKVSEPGADKIMRQPWARRKVGSRNAKSLLAPPVGLGSYNDASPKLEFESSCFFFGHTALSSDCRHSKFL